MYRRPAQHEGTLFFALPNGRALMFKLVGTASAPAVSGTVTQTTPAKQNLSFTLPVTNWLKVCASVGVCAQMCACARVSAPVQWFGMVVRRVTDGVGVRTCG